MCHKSNEDSDTEGWGNWGNVRKKNYNSLRLASGIFLVILLFALIGLGVSGWGGVQTTIDQQFAVSATVTPTLSKENQATPTNTPGPSPTPVGKPTATSTPLPAWVGDKNSVQTAARQHYSGLVIVGGILVLLPALLMAAFAFQRVPHLTKELGEDLIKLGIFQSEVNPDEEKKKLANKIKELAPDIRTSTVMGMVDRLDDINPEYEDIKILAEDGFPAEKVQDLQSFILDTYTRARQSAEKDDEINFKDYISARFGWFEYLLPLTVLSLFLLVCIVWLFWPSGVPDFTQFVKDVNFTTYFTEKMASMLPALAGVLAAYVFLIFQLVRRNNASDLTPGSFWEALKRLAVVFILGLVLSALGNQEPGLKNGGLIVIAVLIGLFPVGFLSLVARAAQALLQAVFEKWLKGLTPEGKLQTGKDMAARLYARHELTLLDDLDEWDTIRLEEANIYGLQGMAMANLANLLAWTPFTTPQIVDWVDQALLFLGTGAEPESSYARTFRTIGLRRASALIEMGKDEKGKDTITLAARSVQASGVFDPLPVAQLAAVRAQLLVKDMQDKVAKVKSTAEDADLNETLISDIESAISLIASAKALVDTAHEQVKAGGELLKDALANQADPLQSALKAADEEAKKALTELKSITGETPKVSKKLATSLKTIGDKLAGDPDANKRAKDLVDELDRIANPMKETEKKAGELVAKAEEIQKAAEKTTTNVPASVTEAADMLTALTTSGKDAQKRIKADTDLEKVLSKVDELVKELESDEDTKAKKLLGDEKLKKKDSWTTAGADNKAKCAADADKLVEVAKEIESKAKIASGEVASLRTEKSASSASLPLTVEVLETILKGLEENANLKRIRRYYVLEGKSVPEVQE
jgi:hypothetical protein